MLVVVSIPCLPKQDRYTHGLTTHLKVLMSDHNPVEDEVAFSTDFLLTWPVIGGGVALGLASIGL
jgi:hypothetical protein